MSDQKQLTLILKKWQQGDKQAFDELMPEVYTQLRQVAQRQLKQGRNSIQCTELISEAYLKMLDITAINWQDRAHFFAMAARTMRRILVDRYRQKSAGKRGSDLTLLTLTSADSVTDQAQNNEVELDALEDALITLEQFDAALADLVTMKFYGGMTYREMAAVLEVSERSIRRNWTVARMWLNRELNS